MEKHNLPLEDKNFKECKNFGDVINLVNTAAKQGSPYRTPEYYAAIHAFNWFWESLTIEEPDNVDNLTFEEIEEVLEDFFIWDAEYDETLAKQIIKNNFDNWYKQLLEQYKANHK